MASPLRTITIKSAAELRDDMLRTYSNGLVRLGETAPDVSFGTEIFLRFSAIAQQIAIAGSNVELKADAMMPDSALGEGGEDLSRIARFLAISLRAAGISTGGIILAASVATAILVPTGSQLIDPAGLTYKVTVGGSYVTGDRIPIESLDTGTRTNLGEGVVLRWTVPPPFCAQTAEVSEGGLTGGTDAETFEGLRARILERYRNPPSGGNAAALTLAAEDSTVAVQKAFAFCCYSGPATVALIVVGAPTATSKDRDVDSLVISTIVEPAVLAVLPEFADVLVQTVDNVSTDVAIGLSLSETNGWVNSTPFPVYASQGFADVTDAFSSTNIRINSDVPPVAGVSRICWLSPLDWTFYSATVVSFTGLGPYTCVLDQPLPGITFGQYISPLATNSETYFDALLAMFARLGPGEKTSLAGLLPRALRQPRPSQNYPSDIGPSVLKFVSDVGAEVLDAAYLYRSTTSPTVPSLATDQPEILVPRKLAFYPLE